MGQITPTAPLSSSSGGLIPALDLPTPVMAFPVGFLISCPGLLGDGCSTSHAAGGNQSSRLRSHTCLPVQIIGTELKVGSYTLMIDALQRLHFLAFGRRASLPERVPAVAQVALFLCAFLWPSRQHPAIDLSCSWPGISEALARVLPLFSGDRVPLRVHSSTT